MENLIYKGTKYVANRQNYSPSRKNGSIKNL